MEQMREQFVRAVTAALVEAPDSPAKEELVEELSGNLYRRYLDLTAEGVPSEEAYTRALEDLGDTGELVEYLKGLEPEGENAGDTLEDLVGDIVRDALGQARDALRQARDTLGQRGKTTWRSRDGSFEVHWDDHDDDHGAHPYGEDHQAQEEPGSGDFAPVDGPSRPVSGSIIPAGGIRGVDVETVSGDVTICLSQEDGDIRLAGDVDKLEVRISRGLDSANVILTLPRRRWEFVQLATVSGDVMVGESLEAERLAVRTVSGDITCHRGTWRQLAAKSASGEVRTEGAVDWAKLSSASGDVELRGTVGVARMNSASGNVRLESSCLPREGKLTSQSGNCTLCLPDQGPFGVDYRTVSGHFRSDFFQGTMGGRKSVFTYQGGAGPVYRLSTISGDLYLSKC